MGSEDPYARWGDRTDLRDADGRRVLTYTLAGNTRSGRRWADGVWRPASVSATEAASAAAQHLAGWALSVSDPPLAEALRARGSEDLRHALVMSSRLADLTAPPPADRFADSGMAVWPLSAQQLSRHSLELGQLHCKAYSPTHPDHLGVEPEMAATELRAVAQGEILGALMAQSRVAIASGAMVGACLLVERPGEAPDGGPWVLDLFRDPESYLKGIGRALLVAVVDAARADRLPAVSLVVSHSNVRAQRLYANLGFSVAEESWTLAPPSTQAGRALTPSWLHPDT